jgi:hypothetical protein
MTTRQTFLKGLVLLPPAAGLMTAAARSDSSKASQDSMHYQSTPSGGKQCSGCQFFIPAGDPKANGTCKVVDGSISPNGYCMAYTAK